MAPCVDNGLITLATCKPNIRAYAKGGDWVVGFRSVANGAPAGLVVWAGRVESSLEVGAYEHAYRGRSDAIYRRRDNGKLKRLRPDYHPGDEQLHRDTDNPVLVFAREAAWYFGREPEMLPEHLMHLAPRSTDRDRLVNGANAEDVIALQHWLSSLAPAGVHAPPRDPPPIKRARC